MLALTMVVSVGVYQQVIQREDTIPGSAGGVGPPTGERGVVMPDDVIVAFAGAAAVGDYATAQGYLEATPMLYGIWKDQHENFQAEIRGYQIVRRETVGQTTTAVVRFDLVSNGATCITLTLNERTQRIWMDRGYSECATQ
jgi:hypothetical protein